MGRILRRLTAVGVTVVVHVVMENVFLTEVGFKVDGFPCTVIGGGAFYAIKSQESIYNADRLDRHR